MGMQGFYYENINLQYWKLSILIPYKSLNNKSQNPSDKLSIQPLFKDPSPLF